MFCPIVFQKKIKKKAFFGEDFIEGGVEAQEKNIYNVAFPSDIEPKGSFYVSGGVTNGQVKGLISVGYINGHEPINNGVKISENPILEGSPGYVCVKLSYSTKGIGVLGPSEYYCGEIVFSSFFGPVGGNYFHPIALFRALGKDKQITNCDLSFDANWSLLSGYKYYISAA